MTEERIIKLIEDLLLKYGVFYTIILFLSTVIIALILYFFKSRISAISKEISQINIEEHKNDLEIAGEIYKKKLNALFQSEELHTNIIFNTIHQFIEKKIAFYQKVYSLFFEYRETWSYDKNTKDDEISLMWNKLQEARIDLFLNSIYLGGLIDPLLDAVIAMSDDLRDKITEIKNPTSHLLSAYYQSTESSKRPRHIISDKIHEAEKWIRNYLSSKELWEITISKKDQDDAYKKLIEENRNLQDFIKQMKK